ncbi:MAG: hypothetical protein ACK5MD_03850 [Flavobacteriales bacterium]
MSLITFVVRAQEISFGLSDEKIQNSHSGYFILNYFPNMVDTTNFLRQEDEKYLIKILNFVEKYPNIKFRLEIHENQRANKKYQLEYSMKVAKSISEYIKINYLLMNNLQLNRLWFYKSYSTREKKR